MSYEEPSSRERSVLGPMASFAIRSLAVLIAVGLALGWFLHVILTGREADAGAIAAGLAAGLGLTYAALFHIQAGVTRRLHARRRRLEGQTLRLQALVDAIGDVTSPLREAEMLDGLVDAAIQLGGARSGAVVLTRNDRTVHVVSRGDVPSRLLDPALARRGFPRSGACLLAPLAHEGELAGWVAVCRDDGDEPFTRQEEELVVALTTQAGIALHHARTMDIFLNLIDSVPGPVIMVDLEGRVTSWNRGAERLYGWSEREVLGRMLPVLCEKDRPGMAERLRAIAAGDRIEGLELCHRTRDGRTLEVATSISPIREPGGEVVGGLGIVHDLTDIRRAERERTEALESVVEQLEELNRLQSDFVAIASHELRTPLTSIIGYIKTLRIRPEATDAQREQFLAAIDRQADRLYALVQELLTASRVETGPSPNGSEPIRVTALLDDMADAFPEDRERILIDSPQPATVIVSEEAALRAGTNLLDNALKYSPADAPVSLRGRVERDHLVIEVEDRGKGIPARDLPHVFGRFTQAEEAHTRTAGGFGLGLYIVKRVVERAGGTVEVESEVGQGSTFRLRLPVSEKGAVAEPA